MFTNTFANQIATFVKEAIRIIRSSSTPSEYEQVIRYSVKNDERKGLKMVKQSIPRWYDLPKSIRQKIFSLYSFYRACKLAKNEKLVLNSIGQQICVGETGLKFSSVEDVVSSILLDYLIEVQVLKFDRKQLEKLLTAFSDFLDIEKKYIEATFIAPLEDFKMRGKQIQIAENILIKKIKFNDLPALINRHNILTRYFGLGLHRWFEYALFKKVRLSKWVERKPEDSRAYEVQNISSTIYYEMLYLRAFTRLQPSNPTFVIDYPGWSSLGISNTIREPLWRRDTGGFIPDGFELSRRELRQYIKLRKKLEQMKSDSRERINIALRRLAFAYERTASSDRLIDLIIGLEALCLEGEYELSFRVSLRVAFLIGRNTEERMQIYKIIKKAYDLRSKAVHGKVVSEYIGSDRGLVKYPAGKKAWNIKSLNSDEINDIRRIVLIVTECLREVIRQVVLRGQPLSHEEWLRLVIQGKL